MTYRVWATKYDDLDEKTLSSWESLEGRAMESNVYLSPLFVIPAIRHLEGPRGMRDAIFVFVERTSSRGSGLVGAGVFVKCLGMRRFPLPHLRAYRSPYSYLSGVLLDGDEAQQVLRALFRFFCDKGVPWHGVHFANSPSESPQARLMAAVAEECGAEWHEYEKCSRAVFIPAEGGEAYMRSQFSSRRLKELRRLKRRLEEQGKMEWRALFGAEVDERSVERFLDLEHMGWKGEEGTSLRSRHTHEKFFREMIKGFRERGRLFFTELSLDGITIATTTNLISRGSGFAFKIGWHPDYAKMSPGVLNEVEFIYQAPALFRDMHCLDSGADEGSFIDQLWSGRRILASGVLGTTSIAKKVLSEVGRLRRVKRWAVSVKTRIQEGICALL